MYRYAFDRYDAERSTGLSRADLDSTAGALRAYFNNGEKTFYHTVSEDGPQTSVFNARETRHMQDIKSLFVIVNRAQELSVVYVLAYIVAMFIWSREGSLRQLAGQSLPVSDWVRYSSAHRYLRGVRIPVRVRSLPHDRVLDDFWQLNPETDHLIQMFPEPFWRDMTIFLGLMCAAEALVITVISGVYLLGTRTERRRLPSGVSMEGRRTGRLSYDRAQRPAPPRALRASNTVEASCGSRRSSGDCGCSALLSADASGAVAHTSVQAVLTGVPSHSRSTMDLTPLSRRRSSMCSPRATRRRRSSRKG